MQKKTVPMYAGSHMLFNWLLIAKFALGIKGAAIATGIGFIIAFVMAILPFLTKKAVLKPFASSFNKHAARHILYSGLSEGLSEMGTGITTFLFNITLMRYVGEMNEGNEQVLAFSVDGAKLYAFAFLVNDCGSQLFYSHWQPEESGIYRIEQRYCMDRGRHCRVAGFAWYSGNLADGSDRRICYGCIVWVLTVSAL